MDSINAAIMDEYLDQLDREVAALEAQRNEDLAWWGYYQRGLVSYEEWRQWSITVDSQRTTMERMYHE